MSVSRSELLKWLHELLEIDIKKVEQCGKGAVFCQLMDYCYRDVPMQKVKFDVTLEYEYRNNWKVLQLLFTKHKITKVIDVEKLVKCRLQDNLELLQWFKKHCDEKAPFEPYNAVARRQGAPGGTRLSLSSTPRPPLSAGRRVLSGTPATTAPPRRALLTRTSTPPTNGSTGAGAGRSSSSTKELTETQRQLDLSHLETSQLKLMCDALETERNFYFNKLREIEILSQNILDPESSRSTNVEELTVPQVMEQVQKILYRVDDGFQLNEVDEESF